MRTNIACIKHSKHCLYVDKFNVKIYTFVPTRGCLHEPYRKGWPYSARSRVLFEILSKNCLRLLRSHLVGLEISHINATEGAGPPQTQVFEGFFD